MHVTSLRGRFSILSLATTATLLPLLVVSLTLIAISVRSSRRLSDNLGRAVVTQTVDRVNDSIDRYFRTAAHLSAWVQTAVGYGAVDPDDMEAWRSRILACLDSDSGISSIGFANVARGEYVYIFQHGKAREIGRMGGGIPPGQIATWGLDDAARPIESTRRVDPFAIQTRPWFRQALAERQPRWTAPYDWFLGSIGNGAGQAAPLRGISFASVILARGESVAATSDASHSPASRPSASLAGVPRGFPRPDDLSVHGILSVDVSLDQISTLLAETAKPLGASILMTDTSGRLLACSDARAAANWPATVNADGSGALDGTKLAALGPVERELARQVALRGRSFVQRVNGGEAPAQLRIDGRTFWTADVPLPVSASDTWRLLVAIPDQPILLDAESSIRKSMWIGAMYAALASVLSAVLARWVARPIRRLASFATSVGQGRFDQQIDGRPPVTREVSDLTSALDEMARNLRERVALLSAKEAAEAAGAAKARLIAHVSHEFRTPLNAIVGYASLLREGAQKESRERDAQDAQNILIAGRHLLTMFENLLDLSRADAGRLPVHRVNFAVRDLFDAVERTLRPVVERNGNRFIVDPPVPPDLRVSSDPGRLTQILTNVIGNAGKFTRNGEVRLNTQSLTAAPLPGGVSPAIQIVVADTGVGIATEDLPHVFEPFVQVHRPNAAVATAPEGAGLGLAISRQLCELLGGTIEIDSQLGQGTRVRITLPANALERADSLSNAIGTAAGEAAVQ